MTNILSTILIALCFAAILGVNFGQKHIKDMQAKGIFQTSSTVIQGIGFLSSIIITIVNNLLSIFSRKFSAYERYPTHTSYNIAVIKKLAVAQFLNTAIVTLVVSLIVQGYYNNQIPIWIKGGLVYNMFFVFLTNAATPPLMALINPVHVLRSCKRRSELSKGSRSKLTQGQANLLFQGPQIDMALKYAVVLKTVFLSAFYANVLPIGMVFSIVGLFLVYWVDKYLLLRRHCRPKELSKELPEEMADILEWFLVIFGAGNCIFDKILYDKVNPFNYAALALGGLYLLIPTRPIVKCISPPEVEERVTNYNDYRLKFGTDYDRENPVTHEDALKEFFNDMLADTDDDNVKNQINNLMQGGGGGEGGKILKGYAHKNAGQMQQQAVMRGFPQPGQPLPGFHHPMGPGGHGPMGYPRPPGIFNPYGSSVFRPKMNQIHPGFNPGPGPQFQGPPPQFQHPRPQFQQPQPQPQFQQPQPQPQFHQPQPQPQFQQPQPQPQFHQPQPQPQFQGQPQPQQQFQGQPQPQPQFMQQPQPQPQFQQPQPQPQFQGQPQPQFQPQMQPQFKPQPQFQGPPQGFPGQQGMPMQGFPGPQGMPMQGFPGQQGMPNQGFPGQQGMPMQVIHQGGPGPNYNIQGQNPGGLIQPRFGGPGF